MGSFLRSGVTFLVLSWVAIPKPLAAQTRFYTHHAHLYASGHQVGVIQNAPLHDLGWRNQALNVRYADDAAIIVVEVRPRDPMTRLMHGVGRDVSLGAPSRFALVMTEGTWAPVVGHSSRGTLIRLPGQLPGEQAAVPDGVVPIPGLPESRRTAFWAEPEREGFRQLCVRFVIRNGPTFAAARWWPRHGGPDGPISYRLAAEGASGFVPIEIYQAGFITYGYTWRPQDRVDCGFGAGVGPGGGQTALVVPVGQAVRIAAGTPLFATPRASASFVTTLTELIGYAQVGHTAPRHGRRQWFVGYRSGNTAWYVAAWIDNPQSLQPIAAPPRHVQLPPT